MERKLTEKQLDALRSIQRDGENHGLRSTSLGTLRDHGLVSKRGTPKLTKKGEKAIAA